MVTVDQYQQAERELTLPEWRRGWRIHAAVYVLVNAALLALNVALVTTTDAGFWWFPFPLVGWGIGLTMHYLHGVRWAERELRARQAQVEQRAERLRAA
jgi:hypothetical protein